MAVDEMVNNASTPKEFYYQIDGAIIGPVTGIALRDAALAGNVVSTTPISYSPSGGWTTAARVRGLFDERGKPLPHPPETVKALYDSRETPRSDSSGQATPQIDELLDRWEEACDEDKSISIEELCRDCPELVDELRQKIRQLKWVDDVLATQEEVGSDEVEASEIPKTLGRYRLDKLVGQGGFGQVWEAYDPELDRVVAIKILRPERQGSVIQSERFLAEAKKVAKLSHKNIVAIHDVGRESGLCYMVTELIDGSDLAQLLMNEKLAVVEAVHIVAKIADALQHAHDNGVVHRDVKPHNILLDKQREPYITDFGIAVTDVELLNGGADTAGTPAYMAPEQAEFYNPKIDQRCDIYSLGVVLHELLVGSVPFDAATLWALRNRQKQDLVADLSTRNPKVSHSLNDVCIKAIASNQADRWQSAREFADQLREVLKLHPYNKPTSPPIKRFVSPATASKLRRRRFIAGARTTAIISALLGFLLCTGILQYVGDIGARIPEVVANETSEDKQPRLYAAGRMALFVFLCVIMLVRASAALHFFRSITEQLFKTLRK